LLRLLLLIPFALLVAMGFGVAALMLASVVSPDLGLLIAGGAGRLMDMLFGLAEAGVDPGPEALAAFRLAGMLGLAIVVAPAILVALLSEVFRFRSGIVQSGLAGLFAALLPMALLGLSRVPSEAEMRVIGGLFLVGAVTGFVYWLIAGREAGGVRRADTASD